MDWFHAKFPENTLHSAFALTVLLTSIVIISTCGAFFVKFISIDLEQSLYALTNIGGTIDKVYALIVAHFNRDKIRMIFDHLVEIYSERT